MAPGLDRVRLPNLTAGRKDVRKASSACLTCRKKKVRCSGTSPCQYCVKRGLDCIIRGQCPKRVFLASRVEELESRLAQYENVDKNTTSNTQDDSPQGAAASAPAITQTVPLSQRPQLSPQTDPGRGNTPPRSPILHGPSPSFSAPSMRNGPTQSSPASTIPVPASMSSSRNFSSMVQDLLSPQGDGSKSSRTPSSNQAKEPTMDPAPLRISSQDFPNLPSHQEAQRLLETAMFYIGHTQHHIDARDFSDRLWVFYANRDDPNQLASPWCLEMMLVIAIGTLFDANPEGNGEFSGIELFDYVHKNLPTLSEMHSYGKIGVEIFGLFAIYLQNFHKREEAYLYISTALRLAISHKYHQVSGTKHLMKSEKVHLTRLFWTIYMQERRLAAATGNPSGIRDQSIDVELPTNSPGFAPAGPICINIKIARVTGRILSVLYGPDLHTEDTFVPNVQEIVKSLYEISQEIPSDTAKDFQGMGPDLCLRTTGSLHLMLYQATLLTLRPIMLHMAKLVLRGEGPSSPGQNTSQLERLSRTCSEAARRLLKVVCSLRNRNILAIHGFFDFDAVCSSSFIMILVAILDSVCDDGQKFSPSPGLPDALETMQYLADNGSKHAAQRIKDLRGICRLMSHKIQSLQAMNNSPNTGDGSNGNFNNYNVLNGTAATPGNHRNLETGDQLGGLENSAQGQQLRLDETPGQDMQLEPDLWDNFAHIWIPPTDNRGENIYQDVSMVDISPDEYYKCYFSMYNNADWSLTGEEMGGFAELGRHIQDV
ncbi:hypothetical protein BGZ61DRAFT_447607 [Ilyonectria robusta]|uniref:uncharacterized protein n=1 Tax=Ilyonectria robusta TaxID=1079257 RepID=UPI001E8EA8F7|nr:uncharacterized protein BGZ61DRAFT_447607 [Ilyonectria robusta]KAH8721890.1 hypothetical protein BGZ61DRAFT_447607 [Ilyonectria robusta]